MLTTSTNSESAVLSEIAAGGGLSLPQIARRLPSCRKDRPVSPSCVWRWISHGIRLADGRVVKLEAARLAGRWLSSAAAIERFLAAQQPPRAEEAGPAPRTAGARQRAAERAAEQLKKMGV